MAKKKTDPNTTADTDPLEQSGTLPPEFLPEEVPADSEASPSETEGAPCVPEPSPDDPLVTATSPEDDPQDGSTALPASVVEPDSEFADLLQELSGNPQSQSPDTDPLTLPPLEPSGGPGDADADGALLLSSDDSNAVNSQLPEDIAVPQDAAVTLPRERILTIDARDEVQTEADREATIWHEIQNSYRTRRIMTGTLDGIERTDSGLTLAVVNYKGFRVAIPIKEMMLYSERLPSGPEYAELMDQLSRILNSRLGSEIDFIVKGYDNHSRSVAASRKDAMLRKRQTFYMDTDELGNYMIYEGRVVQARVVAVAEKIVRVEVFGVECAIRAQGLSWEWIGNARDHFCVGDRVLVRILSIDRPDVEHITIEADMRSVSSSTNQDNLKKCVLQARYAGRVTDVHNGIVYIRLNNGVNAIAHSCLDRRTPGKKDDVSFAVTKLDEAQGVAVGIITRIIKQNI